MGAWSWSATSPSWCSLDIWVSFVYPTPNPKCLIFAVHVSFVSSVLVAIKISFSVCHMKIWWFHWRGRKETFLCCWSIGLVYRKIYRKKTHLMVKKIPTKPIQWYSAGSDLPVWNYFDRSPTELRNGHAQPRSTPSRSHNACAAVGVGTGHRVGRWSPGTPAGALDVFSWKTWEKTWKLGFFTMRNSTTLW